MEKFTTLTSTCVPLKVDDIDTDQIIPARFLKATTREGFGENLFRDWRYHENGTPRKDFPLNDKRYRGAILLAGRNFGCGSSREHAAWALYDYGFRAIVSSDFADIFRNNALNNGLLPVKVSSGFMEKMFEMVENDPGSTATIDLQNQLIQADKIKQKERFEINPYRKQCLIKGFDDIDYLLNIKEKILDYAKKREEQAF